MPDPLHSGAARSPISPGTRHFVIPKDGNEFPQIPTYIRCDQDGTAVVVDEAGTTITYNMLQGEILPFRPVKITGGTAVLIGYY